MQKLHDHPLGGGGGVANRRNPFSFAKYPKLGGGPLQPPPGPASYVPSFGGGRFAAGPERRFSGDNGTGEFRNNGGGPVIGRGLFGGGGGGREEEDNPALAAHGRVQFGTTLAAAAASNKVDFTARVVESFSGLHLDGVGGGGGDPRMLGTPESGELFHSLFLFTSNVNRNFMQSSTDKWGKKTFTVVLEDFNKCKLKISLSKAPCLL
jgi:hypothetical protein